MFDCIVVYKKVEVTLRGAITFFVFKEELTTVPVKLPSPGLTMAIVQAPGPDQSWLFLFHPSVLYVCQRTGYYFYIGKFVRELPSGRRLGYFPYPHAGFWSDVPYELLIFISAPTVPMKNLNQNHRCANQKRNDSVD